MWYLSKVFKCLPILPILMTSIVSVIVPYVWPVLNIWFECPEFALLLLIAWMCSLYLVLNVLPVWPTYFNGQSRHFIWYIPLLLYLSVCVVLCFNMSLIVFFVWNTTLIYVFLKSLVICLTSFPQYVNVAHFFLCVLVLQVYFVSVVVIVIYQVDMCYIRFSVVCSL
jgi:hypothetical protein